MAGTQIRPAMAGKGTIPTLRPEIRMQSFSSDGVKIAFIDMAPTSDEPKHRTVVLVHGFAESTVAWSLTAPELAKNHVVYAIDLPGYASDRRAWLACGVLAARIFR